MGGEKFLGGKNVKNAPNAADMTQNSPFLCWTCQVWANFNTSEIILGETGGDKKMLGGTNAPMSPCGTAIEYVDVHVALVSGWQI